MATKRIKILRFIAKISYYTGLIYLFDFLNKKIMKKTIIILMYHRVYDIINNYDLEGDAIVTKKDFERQIEYITKKYNTVHLESIFDNYKDSIKSFKNPVIAITFDDGYKDCFLNVYPVLKKYSATATFFIATDYVCTDKFYWWDKLAYLLNNTELPTLSIAGIGTYSIKNSFYKHNAKIDICRKLKNLTEKDKENILSDIENKIGIIGTKFSGRLVNNLFLTWEDIIEMSRNEMTIGSHTCSHAILTKISWENMINEVIQSKFIIQKHINKDVNVFCYPNGDFNERIKNFLKINGFKVAVTTLCGLNTDKDDLYSLKRINMNSDIDFFLFRLELTGIIDIIYYLNNKLKIKKQKKWIKIGLK